MRESNHTEWREAQLKVRSYFDKVGIIMTEREAEQIEVADFGLHQLEKFGLQLITYVNTERVCAKELVLFPHQICPEHLHPPFGNYEGKEETFRCLWGKVYLYVPGEASPDIYRLPPDERKAYFTVWNQIELSPGEQYTIYPGTLHWFQAGTAGAVVSEFSTKSEDEQDVFTDPGIRRLPEIPSR